MVGASSSMPRPHTHSASAANKLCRLGIKPSTSSGRRLRSFTSFVAREQAGTGSRTTAACWKSHFLADGARTAALKRYEQHAMVSQQFEQLLLNVRQKALAAPALPRQLVLERCGLKHLL